MSIISPRFQFYMYSIKFSMSEHPKYYCNHLKIQTNELRLEKTNVLVSDLVRHKPGCTATEDGYRLEISDLESIGIVLSM